MEKKVCGKCGEEKALSSFLPARTTPDGYGNVCDPCRRKRLAKTARAKRKEVRKLKDKLKSVPCGDCNVQYPPYIMQFHHIDPSKKHKDVSAIHSIKELMREIEKCIILCANCHALRELAISSGIK